MTQYLVILTVGTSLLTNDGGRGRNSGTNKSSVEDLNRLCSARENQPDYEWNNGVHNNILQNLNLLNEAQEIGFRPANPGQPHDRLPQELSYLYLFLTNGVQVRDGVSVALLASDSPNGKGCSKVIEQFLRNKIQNGEPWSKITEILATKPVKGLKVDDGKSFEEQGIPNLIDVIHTLVKDHSNSRIIVNLTGGFKAEGPYSALSAAFLGDPENPIQYELHYLFEDTQEIISLPAYPVGLDFPLFHREYPLLRAAEAKPHIYKDALDFRIQGMVAGSGNPLPGLPAILRKRYEDQLSKDPLQYYAGRVAKQFLSTKELQQRLINLITHVGPRIWLGDKLPMAADHAVKHHHDLLEMAQVLLTPIKDSFNEEELFVLLAAVLLHDCGHVIDFLPLNGKDKRIPLFPSEVRNYHHFLSHFRLTDPDLAKPLGWDPELSLSEEVALLCFYHRRTTGWDGNEKMNSPFGGKAFSAPYHLKNETNGVDLPKLVALIRLIDGCDNQSRRVGPIPEGRMLRDLFERDCKTWKERMKQIIDPALAAFGKPDPSIEWQKNAHDFLETISERLNNGGEPQDEDENFWKTRVETAKLLATGSGSPDCLQKAWVWTEAARALDEWSIRNRQDPHFWKHEVVRRIELLPGEFNGSKWSFQVILTPDQQVTFWNSEKKKEMNLWKYVRNNQSKEKIPEKTEVKEKFRDFKQWLEREIWSEMLPKGQKDENCSPLLKYLADASGKTIQLTYQWEGENPFKEFSEPCGQCRNSNG